MSYRWNGPGGRGAMRSRRKQKRQEAEMRNSSYRMEIDNLMRTHNISEVEANRVRNATIKALLIKRMTVRPVNAHS